MDTTPPLLVRDATYRDMPRLIELAGQFYSAAISNCGIPFNPESAVRFYNGMISMHLCLVVEAEGKVVGVLGGVAGPHIANDAYKVGSELLWWVEPEHRKSGAGLLLIDAIEQRARELGLVKWMMMAIDAHGGERIGRIYEERGYTLTERSYTKDL